MRRSLSTSSWEWLCGCGPGVPSGRSRRTPSRTLVAHCVSASVAGGRRMSSAHVSSPSAALVGEASAGCAWETGAAPSSSASRAGASG
eukprot:5870101-Pyramimonas_sp.AAC.1